MHQIQRGQFANLELIASGRLASQTHQMKAPVCFVLACFAANLALSNLGTAEANKVWPQFRGPNASGVADPGSPPVTFGPETNLAWKTSVPAGLSSPCIWENRIFLSAYEDGALQTLCLSRSTGKLLWQQRIQFEHIEVKHRANHPASPTPATDGTVVCVYFPAIGLVTYDFTGFELWRRVLPVPVNPYGAAASPAMLDGRLILNCEDDSTNSCLLALNPGTGNELWRVNRRGVSSTYSTPILWQHNEQADLMHASSLQLMAFDPRTGQPRWFIGGLEWMSQVATPVLADGLLFVMSRSNADDKENDFAATLTSLDANRDGRLATAELPEIYGRWIFTIDRDGNGFITAAEWEPYYSSMKRSDYGLMAVRPGGEGDLTDTHIAWKQKKGIPQVPSPLYYRGRVYMVNDGGRVSCFEAQTGKVRYQQERLGAEGEYFSSPVAASGRIYFGSNRGTVTVIEAGDELRVLARNELGESMIATPAIVENSLYLRTGSHLWAFHD